MFARVCTPPRVRALQSKRPQTIGSSGSKPDARERSTIDQYRQHVKLHIKPRLGRTKLAQLTPTQVDNFRDELLAELSRPLARKVLTSFKSILKVANYSQVAANVTIGRDKRGKRKLEVGVDLPTPEKSDA